jgi:holo-[acyl-carrier protein] synthase
MGVLNLKGGQPVMILTGGAAARLDAMVPRGLIPKIHVSITDDYPYAQAFVVIDTQPVPEI